jgi:uncharacterized protein (TIGR03435 family)
MRKLLGVVSAGIALMTGAAWAQTPAAPAFEVATIKPSAPMNPAMVASGKLHVGMQIDAARVDIGFFSLADLIRTAYAVKAYQVSGPDWMSGQRFDIVAKMPEGATKEQVPEMLQALLAERFKLAVHRESKEHSVYALVQGKGGAKLKESAPDPEAPAADKEKGGMVIGQGSSQLRVSGNPASGMVVSNAESGTTRMTMVNGAMHMESSKMSMEKFAELISRFVDRPVVDMTELKGNYQVALDLSMDDIRNVARTAGVSIPAMEPAAEPGKAPADAASEPGGTVLTSVQQLGLKLEARKAPMETIVVDRLEKAPTENYGATAAVS